MLGTVDVIFFLISIGGSVGTFCLSPCRYSSVLLLNLFLLVSRYPLILKILVKYFVWGASGESKILEVLLHTHLEKLLLLFVSELV